MKDDFEADDEIRKLYRESIWRQVKKPEVQEGKKLFVSTYFQKEPLFILRPPVFAPILGFIALFLVVLFLNRPEQPAFKTAPLLEKPAVEVKRVTSSVGSTMVFQKIVNDIPITIVWVFAGG